MIAKKHKAFLNGMATEIRSYVYRAAMVVIMVVIVAVGTACQSAHAVSTSSALNLDGDSETTISFEIMGAHHSTSSQTLDRHCVTHAVLPAELLFDVKPAVQTGEPARVTIRIVSHSDTDLPPPKRT